MAYRTLALAAAIALPIGIAACGDDDDDGGTNAGGELSADAERGREVAESNGCNSCHRAEGGIGPSWNGLYGSTVTLDDGSTVLADDEYVERAIIDPGAQVVDGFNVSMPNNDLSEEDLASIVAYIREIGSDGATDNGGTSE